MTSPYLAPSLAALGYTGVTGTTPYTPGSAAQITTLQNQYATALQGQTIAAATAGTIHLNINFDGTQNNKAYVVDGEFKTNIGNICNLQAVGALERNTIYMTGIGAQTVEPGTLLPNGNPDPRASVSKLDAFPSNAGRIGNEILETAYERLKARVTEILADNPNAQIALNLAGFSRGGAEAVAFANLVNERGIPGLYRAGAVPINSLALFDPVAQTDGLFVSKTAMKPVKTPITAAATARALPGRALRPVQAQAGQTYFVEYDSSKGLLLGWGLLSGSAVKTKEQALVDLKDLKQAN